VRPDRLNRQLLCHAENNVSAGTWHRLSAGNWPNEQSEDSHCPRASRRISANIRLLAPNNWRLPAPLPRAMRQMKKAQLHQKLRLG
jgi:hypothetical protein